MPARTWSARTMGCAYDAELANTDVTVYSLIKLCGRESLVT